MKSDFEPTLSSEEAYWTGLIHADGSVGTSTTRFAQKHIEPVQKFLDFLGQDSKISRTSRQTNFGHNVKYTASCSRISVPLSRLGVKADLCPELLTNKHFWRGLIDGDGSVMNTDMPRIVLCGRLVDMTNFSRWCASLFGYKGPTPYQHKTTGVWYVGLGAGKAKVLGLYLYDGEYSAIDRKQTTALSFRDVVTRSKAAIKVSA